MSKIDTLYVAVPKAETTMAMIASSTGGVVLSNSTHFLFKHEPPELALFSSYEYMNHDDLMAQIDDWVDYSEI